MLTLIFISLPIQTLNTCPWVFPSFNAVIQGKYQERRHSYTHRHFEYEIAYHDAMMVQ
jgi:hypothetical protein